MSIFCSNYVSSLEHIYLLQVLLYLDFTENMDIFWRLKHLVAMNVLKINRCNFFDCKIQTKLRAIRLISGTLSIFHFEMSTFCNRSSGIRSAITLRTGNYSVFNALFWRLVESWCQFEGEAYIIALILQVIHKSKYKNVFTYSYLQAIFIAQLK